MAFTKINAAGIGSTETVTLDGLTVINDGSFGGNVSVGGTLTYEDVTNIDSVGLITARAGVVVGSGITLSKDGDVFFTGIATGNGSGLTALNASNISSGTVPTARLGSGTASSSTFLRGDSTFQTVNTDLVSDTSPQLGGNLDSNGNNILLDDGDEIRFGTDNDLAISHDGSNGYIVNKTGELNVYSKSGEAGLVLVPDGTSKIYYDGSKKFETTSYGNASNGQLRVTSSNASTVAFSVGDAGTGFYNTGSNAIGYSANGTQKWNINSSGSLTLFDNVNINFGTSSDLQIFHDGSNSVIRDDGTGNLYFQVGTSNKFNTQSGGVQFYGSMYADDSNKIELGDDQDLKIYSDGTNGILEGGGSGANAPLFLNFNTIRLQTQSGGEKYIDCQENGAVELYHNNVHMLSTASDGIQLQTDRKISRHPNGDGAILAVTNASFAKSLFIGGWDNGTNSAGISRIRNSNDNLHIDSGSSGQIYLNAYSDNVTRSRHFRPTVDNLYDIGGGGIRWDDIFATNGTINTSDRNEKNTITDSDLGLSFVNKLKPVSYKFNGKTRTHYGLIAQDVETVLSDISKSTTDFAGFIKTDLPDEFYQEAEPNIPEGKKEGDLKTAAHTEYGLRYTEFISPLIKAVQELSAKNEALEARIKTLEG